jgi:hypothetical protein
MNTIFQQQLKNRMEDVFSIEQTDLGFHHLTVLYKLCTSRLKSMPFMYILPLSVFVAVLAYVVFGPLIVKLATLLQYGF